MKEDLRRDTIRAIFIGVSKDDYRYVTQHLDTYTNVLEVLAFKRGREEAEALTQEKVLRALVVGSGVGAFVAWSLITLAGI